MYLDFGPKRITVNAIAPGGVKTDMYIDAARKYIPNEASMTDEEIDKVSSRFQWCGRKYVIDFKFKAVANMSPLGRIGMPQDVARVVAFLCSEDGGWVNGQTLTLGGGAAM